MSNSKSRRSRRGPAALVVLALLGSAALTGQTVIKAPKNKYTPEQDVQLGQEAAAEVRKQYPVVDDRQIDAYLDELGQQLIEAAPREFHYPAFQYSFTPVNLKDINAFALPGGPMFVNRGMFEAATSEGEVAGVMAHELSHVLLRHGTANATKAQGFQIGAIAGAIAGAVVGGGWGDLIAQGSQFGLGTWLLKYSREYEKQADLLGAQIMARAGYDPRDLGSMFEKIQAEAKGGSPPQWLSSHPNPGNRSQYIAKEAEALTIGANQADAGEFQQIKQRFAAMPPAKSMAELEKRGGTSGGGSAPVSVGTVGQPVSPPSGQYRTQRGGKLFQVSVPANWTALASTNSIKYVPQNGYGDYQGQSVFTHGVELGVARAASRDLRESTDALLQAFARSNPDLRMSGQQRVVQLSGRDAIGTPLVGRSALGDTERIGLYTTFLADGNLFYYITVVPSNEADRYEAAFNRVGQSIRLSDR